MKVLFQECLFVHISPAFIEVVQTTVDLRLREPKNKMQKYFTPLYVTQIVYLSLLGECLNCSHAGDLFQLVVLKPLEILFLYCMTYMKYSLTICNRYTHTTGICLVLFNHFQLCQNKTGRCSKISANLLQPQDRKSHFSQNFLTQNHLKIN